METNNISDNTGDLSKPEIFKNHINELIGKPVQTPNETDNVFPLKAFPLAIQKIIKATNESLNFPVDFIGSSILFATSVAVGNTCHVEIRKGHRENAGIYLTLVGRPGSNKSHPLNFALKPIIERDKRSFQEYERLMREFNRTIVLSKKEREEQGLDEPVKPIHKKIILSDFTPEALAYKHHFNKRGIAVHIDELAGWFKNFNRYSQGSEMEFWLSTWSGEAITIDRKKGEPIFIPHPYVPVAGTIQTGLLIELSRDSRTKNGFMDRILFAILEDCKKESWSETEIDISIINQWSSVIDKLFELELRLDDTLNPNPEILSFNPAAKKMLFDWQKINTALCNVELNDELSGPISKMDRYAPRLALILEMLKWACGESEKVDVGEEAVSGALSLVEYFKKSAEKVNDIISSINPVDQLPELNRKLYEELPECFTTKEGLVVASKFPVPERSFKRFLDHGMLFTRLKHGHYKKKF